LGHNLFGIFSSPQSYLIDSSPELCVVELLPWREHLDRFAHKTTTSGTDLTQINSSLDLLRQLQSVIAIPTEVAKTQEWLVLGTLRLLHELHL